MQRGVRPCPAQPSSRWTRVVYTYDSPLVTCDPPAVSDSSRAYKTMCVGLLIVRHLDGRASGLSLRSVGWVGPAGPPGGGGVRPNPPALEMRFSRRFFWLLFFWVPRTPPPRGYHPSGGSGPEPPRVFKNSLILPYNHTTIYTAIQKTRPYTGFFYQWFMVHEIGKCPTLPAGRYLSVVPTHHPCLWFQDIRPNGWRGRGHLEREPHARVVASTETALRSVFVSVVFVGGDCTCIFFCTYPYFCFQFFALAIFPKTHAFSFPVWFPPCIFQTKSNNRPRARRVFIKSIMSFMRMEAHWYFKFEWICYPGRDVPGTQIQLGYSFVLRLQSCHRISSNGFDLFHLSGRDSIISPTEQIKLGSKFEPDYGSLDWIPTKYFLF